MDSQSAKNSACCGQHVGVDGGKLVKGRKRFYIVDTRATCWPYECR